MYTHQIDFFNNRIKVHVDNGVVTKVENDSTCPGCGERIAGYWLVNNGNAICLTGECIGVDWPVIKLTH